MLVASIVVIVSDHFVRLALEAHAFVTPTACYSIAAINSIHWDLAFIIRTLPNIIFLHIFLEHLIATKSCLLASHTGMIFHLHNPKITLQSMQ